MASLVIAGGAGAGFDFTFTVRGEGTAEAVSKTWGTFPVGPGTYTVPKDGKVSLSVKAEEGWELDTINADGDILPKQRSGVYVLTKIDADTEVGILFKETKKAPAPKAPSIHKINFAIIGGEGSMEATSRTWGATPFGPGEHSVPKGDKVTILVKPKDGWATSLVNLGGTPIGLRADNSYEVTVDTDTVVGIRFTAVHAHKPASVSKPWHEKLMFWKHDAGAHAPAHAPATTAPMPNWLGALGLGVLLGIAVIGYQWSASFGKDTADQVNAQKIQERCLDAAEKGFMLPGCGITAAPRPTQPTQSALGGVHSACPAIQVGRFTVYDGTARKGCTVTIQGDSQARLLGTFTVTNLKDHPYGAFVNMPCDSFEYNGAQAAFVKPGDHNGHRCVTLTKPSDAPDSASITVSSI